MRRTASSVALALLIAVATMQVSYGNKVTVHFVGTRTVDIEATFDTNTTTKNIILSLDTELDFTQLRATPFLDGVIRLGDSSVWMNKTLKSATAKKYTFNFSRAINESQNTNSDSPCSSIALTDNFLCNFELSHGESMTPIYLKIENTLASEPTIKILGGAYNNSKGHFYAKDAAYTKENLKDEYFYFQVESEAKNSLPDRKLILSSVHTDGINILKELRPAFIYFTCPHFKRLTVFETGSELNLETKVNLAQLGVPFDANYSCSATLIFTEFYNGASLVPLKYSTTKFSVKANPNASEWELPFPEVTAFRYDTSMLQANIKNLTGELLAARVAAKMDLGQFALTLQNKSEESKKNVTDNFIAMKGAVTTNFEDMKNLIIVLFVLVGLLTAGLLVQCFVLLKVKKNVGENSHSSVEITGNSPYIKA